MSPAEEENVATRFQRDGYVILRGAIGLEQLEHARRCAERWIGVAHDNPSDVFTNYYMAHRPDQGVLYDLFQRSPDFRELALHPSIVGAVRQVLGPNFLLYENSLVYKPRNANNQVPFHQDFMNRSDEPPKVISWLALDDVDEENGCMYAIPGSHSRGYLPWHKVRGQTHHTRIRSDCINESQALPLLMQAGDLLLFHCCLVHGSKQIDSSRPRRAFRVAFQSIESSKVPRGGPIVASLEDPGALKQNATYSQGLLRKVIRRVGERLAHI